MNQRARPALARWWWGVLIGTAVLGYAAVVARENGELAQLRALQRTAYDAANRAERTVAHRAALEARGTLVRSDVARLVGAPGSSVNAMLSELDRQSSALGIRIVSVNPLSTARQPAAGRPNDLVSEGFTIEAQATFGALLELLDRFATARSIIGIDGVAIEASDAGDPSKPPILRVTLRAHAYELDARWSEEIRS